MAFRGGRGRGRFIGGQANYAKQEPFVLYPEIELLPPPETTDEIKTLISWKSRFESYCKSSPYYLGDGKSKSDPFENIDPERYSDKQKPKDKMSLRELLQPTAAHFPRELVQDSKEESRKKRKKVRWDTETDLKKFDLFEKLEQKHEVEEDKADNAEENKADNAKKEGEEEDEGDDAVLENEGEYSDNGDYDQNVDFDDDEDDFNMEDDKDDEGGIY
ncbi:DNA-directed RNA polymerase III subunit RPC7-like isoform X1 [Punica granatum]|uniref:DNA-directed RNA polymerase III subunit RPC7-like isoform X1 n=2 Tax=Punica granatum TaxID=22663 RepID=A0A6P8CR27_PUNGR|nr:DNA-directed RNA polymerase III subunit RPC7-like isoform X1 [Punica granatum]XP_031384751.1 DNA-directed RNA polymerase III subunit RPC7-like isoform X1 [Punica granatum]XP_031384752.1 DNA-directed RNA polymerase III subunit RPC7-like isoform X1 [Punica granatum]XP_031384753.1 DNA-directed RNA polymerase III subunit RPC7-like isoform X1 [Punica granatum]XP_031384754.1 DNA-directed RNA polymerase III subunit RPC7-like isoform X1 [Punica granatum]